MKQPLWPGTVSEGIDAITAAALGALQGLTEFLPVSSSGHVAVGAAVLGVRENPLALTVFLHLGTLLATILFLRQDVALLLREFVHSTRHPGRLRSTAGGRTLTAILIATVITMVLGVALLHTAEEFTENLRLIGLGFLVSAAFLLASGLANGGRAEVAWWMAIVVGLAQGLAVLPGVSRSGVTIATAMLLGARGSEAFRFSFLISIPAIIGAASFEAGTSAELGSLEGSVWIGGATALVTGYVALVILRRVIFVGRMWMFAFYLLPLGLYLVTR
ncbi:MAG: undecaprenyl-diphosphate phosphatase [Myxococcales bacterium]|nr:undecaprenyl-diphosphate phosphatase [Myxococcales bacterium]